MTHPPTPVEATPLGRAMHIGEVAARTELSLRSLRHWDEVGLLRPSGRTDGGFRLYTEDDVDKILAIRRMKPLGFSLDEMAVAMRDLEKLGAADVDSDDREAALSRLAALQEEAAVRRAKLAAQLAMADEFIDILRVRVGGHTR